jgi:hypothetical protein
MLKHKIVEPELLANEEKPHKRRLEESGEVASEVVTSSGNRVIMGKLKQVVCPSIWNS